MKILSISYLCAVCFLLAFLTDRLPLITLTNKISRLAKNSLGTIRSSTDSDEEKQKIILGNSLAIFVGSVKISAIVLLVLAIGYLLLLTANIFQFPLLNYAETKTGILVSIISFFLYFLLKKLYVRSRL